MKLLLSVMTVLLLSGGCRPGNNPKSDIDDNLPLSVYVFCYKGYKFMRYYNGGLLQIQDSNGLVRCVDTGKND